MNVKTSITLAASGILAAVALTALPASASTIPTPTPTPTATTAPASTTVPNAQALNECGKLTITFNNPTRWAFTFDYKVDNQRPRNAPVAQGTIKEGPLAGQKFGPRYNLVALAGGTSKTIVLPFAAKSGDHKVSWRLAEGAEQKMFLDWSSETVKTTCRATTKAPEFKQPRCSDKDAHIVAAATPGVRYFYRSGYRKQALMEGDNKVKAASSGIVTAVATSKSTVLWGKTSWPVKFTEAPTAYTCS